MKPKLLILLLTLSTVIHAQKLSLVGSNFSFAKGNIDVEVLTEIIQQKQDEVMQRVFHNLIIGNFKNANGGQKSFTTYSYIYNTLNTLTREKNKTVITRQIINNLMEYCFVYGFTQHFIKSGRVETLTVTYRDGRIRKTVSQNLTTLIDDLEKIPVSSSGNLAFLKPTDNEAFVAFNVLLDMAYDIFLKDGSDSLHKKGLFKLLTDKPTLKTWYERDNAFLRDSALSPQTKAVHSSMKTLYEEFTRNPTKITDLLDVYRELEETNFKQETITVKQYKAAKNILRTAIKALKTYSDNNIIGFISEFLLDYTLIEYAPEESNDGLGPQEQGNASGTKSKRGILYVDAEGLISNLHDKFSNNVKRSPVAKYAGFLIPRPFLVIGATHSGAFNRENQLLVNNGTTSNLNNIYFANEKVGLKFTLLDRKYTHSFEPGEEFNLWGGRRRWIEPQEEPVISRHEIFFYGSGLLYNIVDIKSQENFNYTIVGTAYSLTFFNGLMLNAGIALPVSAKGDLSKKYLYTLSFDVPIIEYITAVRRKRSANK